MDRRRFLTTGACSLAAMPLATPISFAAAPWDARLVVIILRGAMDGMDAIRPVGDPNYAALRPDLDDFQPWHAARAHILQKTGRSAAAAAAYRQAIEAAPNLASRKFLQQRLRRLAH